VLNIMKKAVPHGGSGTLVAHVSSALRQKILAEGLKPGDKLPSEARIAEDFGVSRTVVREAVAALRADGLVEPRRGAGVFVVEPVPASVLPFRGVDHARISSIVDLLELRTAVETEAAALAAVRRSTAQEEQILSCHARVQECIEAQVSTAEADFALHVAIAEATNNPRFGEFMRLIGPNAIPRTNLERPPGRDYLAQIFREHESIVAAISGRDSEAARHSMQEHLKGSERRYRAILIARA
jgi:DNA-binding FadR family transcriptional regulator